MTQVPGRATRSTAVPRQDEANCGVEEWILDARNEPWLLDHCPTFTIPTAPLMWMTDAMARVASSRHPGLKVVAVEEVQVLRWLAVAVPAKLRFHTVEVSPTVGPRRVVQVELSVVGAGEPTSSASTSLVASARIVLDVDYPVAGAPTSTSSSLTRVDSPYLAPTVFNGPAFHLVRELRSAPGEAVCTLDVDAGEVPCGLLHVGLLDGALHAIPHGNLNSWSAEIPTGRVAFPLLLKTLEFFSAVPTHGQVTAHVRLDRFDAARNLAWFRIELRQDSNVWCRFELAETAVTKGPFENASLNELRRFFAQRIPVPGLRISRSAAGRTELNVRDVGASDWLPGTLAEVYQCHGRPDQLAVGIAIKEHVATSLGIHPSEVDFDNHSHRAWPKNDPGRVSNLRVSFEQGLVIVTEV